MALPQSLLVIVGDELLGGFTTDRNGPLATRRLFELGYPVRHIEIVADSIEDIAAARATRHRGPAHRPDHRRAGASARLPTIAPMRRWPGPWAASWWRIRPVLATSSRWWPGCTPPAGSRARHPLQRIGGWPGWRRADGSSTTGAAWPRRWPSSWVRRRPAGGGGGGTRAGRPSRWLFVLPGVPREFAAVLEEVLIPEYFSGSRALAVVELRFSRGRRGRPRRADGAAGAGVPRRGGRLLPPAVGPRPGDPAAGRGPGEGARRGGTPQSAAGRRLRGPAHRIRLTCPDTRGRCDLCSTSTMTRGGAPAQSEA